MARIRAGHLCWVGPNGQAGSAVLKASTTPQWMLVWSVESGVLSLWALALASASPSALHVFMARTHALLSWFTVVAQLFVSARRLPDVGQAVAEAFVCGVWALFAMYLVAVLDPGNFGDARLFSLPVVAGTLPLDAWVGLGWFVAAVASAIGMGLGGERPSPLMFHHFGYHLLIVAPSFLALWLYDRDGTTAEPVSQGVGIMLSGVLVTHTLYMMTLVGVWGAFIVLQATGQAMSGLQLERGSWTGWHVLGWVLKAAGRAACVLIPVAAALSVRTEAQAVLLWILVAIGTANALDWVQALEWVLDKDQTNRRRQTMLREDISPQPRSQQDPAALNLSLRTLRNLQD